MKKPRLHIQQIELDPTLPMARDAMRIILEDLEYSQQKASSTGYVADEATISARILRAQRAGIATYYAALHENNEVCGVGTIGSGSRNGAAGIGKFVIREQDQRHHVGSEFMRLLAGVVVEAGFDSLEVAEPPIYARAFYSSLGFRAVEGTIDMAANASQVAGIAPATASAVC